MTKWRRIKRTVQTDFCDFVFDLWTDGSDDVWLPRLPFTDVEIPEDCSAKDLADYVERVSDEARERWIRGEPAC